MSNTIPAGNQTPPATTPQPEPTTPPHQPATNAFTTPTGQGTSRNQPSEPQRRIVVNRATRVERSVFSGAAPTNLSSEIINNVVAPGTAFWSPQTNNDRATIPGPLNLNPLKKRKIIDIDYSAIEPEPDPYLKKFHPDDKDPNAPGIPISAA